VLFIEFWVDGQGDKQLSPYISGKFHLSCYKPETLKK
jgi:hypothetical protein